MFASFLCWLSQYKRVRLVARSRQVPSFKDRNTRWRNVLLCLAIISGLILTGLDAVRASEPVEVGYRDFYFGPNGPSAPTGEKPESKLWWNDGFWWGSLWDPVSEDYHIFRLDLVTQSWVDTGTVLDPRLSRADVLWDGAHLYVVSHSFTTNGQPSSSWGWGRLFRYSYDPAAKSYSLDPGFPVAVTRGRSETLVIAKDSSGQLWVTYIESGKVMVNRSLGSDLIWGEPFILPAKADAVSVDSDDISSLVAFQGDKIGLMWSNQGTSKMYFAVHLDADADNVWQTEETALPGPNCAVSCADDHINLKSLQSDGSGRVFAAVKTSLTSSSAPLIMLLVRDLTGNWDSAVFGRVSDHHTRPIVLLDEEHGRIYMFATINESGGAIYMKESDINNINFPLGPGEPFILSATDTHINNASSTKQNLNSATGLVVLAADSSTDYYFHNYLDLSDGASPPPVIDSFTPASGQPGSSVTILGSGFAGATSVKINNTSAAFTLVSEGEISATVPATSSGPVSVSTPNGAATSVADFTILYPPTIQDFSPKSGPEGTSVRLIGGHLEDVTAVSFNGLPAQFTLGSFQYLDAVVPAGATTGPITVANPDGSTESNEFFTVLPSPGDPVIDSFSPTGGPPGALVTITGSNLQDVHQVTFSGVPASFTYLSGADVIEATVPAGATTGPIAVISEFGSDDSSPDVFTVILPPHISSFTPLEGPVNQQVTITGSHFTGTMRVDFNSIPAIFVIVSDTEIQASVPFEASTGPICVTNPVGTATSSTEFAVTFPPHLNSFSPVEGPVGTRVSIYGSALSTVTEVSFNQVPAEFTIVSDNQIDAIVPLGATTGRIGLHSGGVIVLSSDFFGVHNPPVITSFTPTSGKVGDQVTIYGYYLTGSTEVAFDNGTVGGAQAEFIVVSDGEIQATVPLGADYGEIRITTPEGIGFSTDTFAVHNPPVITSFTPISGIPGDVVTISGYYFTGATEVTFNGVPANFTLTDNREIQATVPQDAVSGEISVTNPHGITFSTQNFTVIQDSPSNWVSADIGAATVGSTQVDGSAVIVTGSGAGLSGTSDSFHYAYATAAGDFEFWVRVTGWDGSSHPWARGGIMMRGSTDPSAPQMNIALTGSKGIRVQWRSASGDRLSEVSGPGSYNLPVWLKLEKTGSAVSAYYSTDGVNWTQIGASRTIGLGPDYLYGMSVTAYRDGAFAQATFGPVNSGGG